MFAITHDWIHAHRTGRGGWTRDQVEAIGESWPPTRGWTTRAVGRDITDEARAVFERSTKALTTPMWGQTTA